MTCGRADGSRPQVAAIGAAPAHESATCAPDMQQPPHRHRLATTTIPAIGLGLRSHAPIVAGDGLQTLGIRGMPDSLHDGFGESQNACLEFHDHAQGLQPA
ncbi:hypothetical protein [Novacetimonas hansenii]|uniref:hypothetical protein n=1 Tax=Novacetimonas hansenii TaxID=436 RepID=UPI00248D52B6|nr:hypothetical protein [Novacetimonas hansenii]